jgi:uncharacterized protein (TIGR03067 family)
LFILLTTSGVGVALGQAPSGDLGKLQGRWWTKTSIGGAGRFALNVIDIEGDKVTTSEPKRAASKTGEPAFEIQSVGRIRVDESGSPKKIDFINTKAPTAKLGDLELPDAFGIYEIAGDTVKLCVNVGLVNHRRPSKFAADPRAGISETTWSRTEPSAEQMLPPGRRGAMAKTKTKAAIAKAPRAARAEQLEAIEGATVIGIADRTISFKTADGQTVTTGTAIAQAFDGDGNRVPRGLDLMVAGNVVDMTVILDNNPTRPNRIREVRLVKGEIGHVVLESKAPATKGKGRVTYQKIPAGPGESYRGAIITNVDHQKQRITVLADGKSVEFAAPNASTAAFDLEGNRLRSPAEARLLKVGNKVDIVLKPRSPDPRFAPFVVSIHLVEGELTDDR